MEKIFTQATVLIIPGLRDHVAAHWQTLLESKLVKVRAVQPAETDKLNCANRVARIEAELKKIEGPVILVAHSAGVLMTVHWAALHQHDIQGALLVTPPDLAESWPEHYPSPEILKNEGWSPLPTQKLPFPNGNIQLTASGSVQANAPLKPTVNGKLNAVNMDKQQVQQTMTGGVVSTAPSPQPSP